MNWRFLALAALLLQPAQADVLQERSQRFHPQWSPEGMVVSQEQLASQAGAEVLARGGNAVDGAVAAAFALAVTLPQAGNLGGGGFLVLWLPGPSPAAARGCLTVQGAVVPRPSPEIRLGLGTAVAINFRETAPLAATAGMFLGADGQVDRQRATRSALSVAVPGSPAGLLLSHRCYGRLPRAAVLAPAIRLARQGFPVGKELADSLQEAAPWLQTDTTTNQLFVQRILRPGDLWRQPQLAASLTRIAEQGEQGFYRGPIADSLVALMGQRGGLIRQADLDGYRAQLVRPLQVRFQGHPVLTMPPPSGGGVSLVQLLQVLEPMPLAQLGLNSAASLHRMVEAMNLAYRDRNHWLGDPDQVTMPLERLLSGAYARQQRARLNLGRHRPAAELTAEFSSSGGTNTTHLSVADPQGGLVALTTTLNFAYGSGISVPGAGFLLNNQMDDFSAKIGRANAYGLLQGGANSIAPGRRPLSSMTPTLVFRPDGRPWLATGSPGGSRIINTVLQVLLNRIVHRLNLAEAVVNARIHSQLWPDQISLEQGISPDTIRLLEGMGHRVVMGPAMGSANSVEVLADGGSLGFADPRRPDGAAVGIRWPPGWGR